MLDNPRLFNYFSHSLGLTYLLYQHHSPTDALLGGGEGGVSGFHKCEAWNGTQDFRCDLTKTEALADLDPNTAAILIQPCPRRLCGLMVRYAGSREGLSLAPFLTV